MLNYQTISFFNFATRAPTQNGAAAAGCGQALRDAAPPGGGQWGPVGASGGQWILADLWSVHNNYGVWLYGLNSELLDIGYSWMLPIYPNDSNCL